MTCYFLHITTVWFRCIVFHIHLTTTLQLIFAPSKHKLRCRVPTSTHIDFAAQACINIISISRSRIWIGAYRMYEQSFCAYEYNATLWYRFQQKNAPFHTKREYPLECSTFICFAECSWMRPTSSLVSVNQHSDNYIQFATNPASCTYYYTHGHNKHR